MGYKTVIGCGQANNDTVDISTGQNNNGVPFTAYGPIGGPICTYSWETTTPVITFANTALNNHSAHTASGMCLQLFINSATQTIFHQLAIGNSIANGGGGNQLASILPSQTTAQVIGDFTHTDAIPAGVPVSLGQGFSTAGSGQAVFTNVFWQADQPGGVSVPLVACLGDSSGVSGKQGYGSATPTYFSVTGGMHVNAIGGAQVYMPTAGSWSSLQMNQVPGGGDTVGNLTHLQSCVTSNYGTATTGNQSLPIIGNVTGIQDDATGTDAVPAGYYINTKLNWPFSFAINFSAIGSTWTSATPNTAPLITADTPITGGAGTPWRAQLGYTVYRAAQSTVSQPARPQEAPGPIPTAGTFSNFNGISSTLGSTYPVQALIDFAPGNQAFNIGAAALGADISHTDALPANKAFDIYYPNGFSGVAVASHAASFQTPSRGGFALMGGIG